LYLAFVIYGSLVPLEFRRIPLREAIDRFAQIEYLQLDIQSRSDLVANFLLFVPLTFLAMGALAGESRSMRAALWGVLVAPAAVGLAFAIEFAQLYFPRRTVSQNDLIAESLGGMVGVAVWVVFGGRITRWWAGLWQTRGAGRRAAQLLTAYLALWALYQWFPFDFLPSPVGVYKQYKEGKVTVIPFADSDRIAPFQYVTKTASLVPIAWLMVLWRRRAPYRFADAVLLTVVLAALAEGGQLVVYSRSASTTDIVFALVGGLLGASLAALIGPAARKPLTQRPAWRSVGPPIKWLMVLAWIAALAAVAWRPFDFRLPPEGLTAAASEAFGKVPLSSHYTLPETLSAAQVLRRFGAFLALGMMLRSLTRWPRGGGKLTGAVAVALIAAGIEFGQLLVPGRVADLATIVIESIGGITGVMLLPPFVRIFINGEE
jgi:VanZ family protein